MARGFDPLRLEELSAAQMPLAKRVMEVSSDGLGGPFGLMLRSPDVGNRFMDVLHFFNSGPTALDPMQRRMTVLMLARMRSVTYAWWAHLRQARKQGIPEETLQALNRGEKPAGLSPADSAVFDFVRETAQAGGPSDAALAKLREHQSDQQIVELTLLCGAYTTVAMLLQLGGITPPPGVDPELRPLASPPFSG